MGLCLALASAPVPASGPDLTASPPPITFTRWRPLGETEAAERYALSFPSAISTPFDANNSVPLVISVPRNRIGRAPVVILLHYWGATDFQLEQDAAEVMAERGIATVAMALPYHLARTPEGRRSGELAVVPDPDRLVQTMSQAVMDVRRTVDWIETQPVFDSQSVGLAGTSLGALVASLSYAVEPRIKSAAFLLGGADLANILFTSSRTGPMRDVLRAQGITEDNLRERLRSVEPLTYLKPDDQRPTFVITARHDNVIRAESSRKLMAALPNHQTLTLETGHYGGFLVQRPLLRTMGTFFQSTLQGKDFSAPGRFYSPTVRFALDLNVEQGLSVGVGLDLWRPRNSDAFGALFLTPRGFQGFTGVEMGRGFSLGITWLPRRVTPGLLWSVVF